MNIKLSDTDGNLENDNRELDFIERNLARDPNDGLTVEGIIELEQAIAELSPQAQIKADCELMAKRDEMFDELVEALCQCLPFISGWAMGSIGCAEIEAIYSRARALQRPVK